MPQATDELRGLMLKWFGDAISEYGPMSFLESHGYVLRQDWQWEPPTYSHTIRYEELACLEFLVTEWDFGWVTTHVSSDRAAAQ